MNALRLYLRSTIGKKFLVGVSGLALSGFLLTHMAGNLLLLAGPQSYNTYSHKLITNPLLIIAEIGLLFMFVMHIALVVQLTLNNRAARPIGYDACARGAKRTCWAARTLILSGLLILCFTVLHLITFKWGTVYETEIEGTRMRDLYTLVNEKFKQPGYVAFYEVCLLVLMAHLSHGISASVQSLGVMSNNDKGLRLLGRLTALLICGGFMIQPLYMFFVGASS